ncbi:V-set domain containing T-cell activation inhibitor 1 isoform X1 [Fundulus heteroclitus]|uniref:V-set domain containing T-cell activation inhibitor 1 isoform X1 n=2 Tax=Fundulus heteroclitus TaxID=8078 RepID=UPI00165BB64B|nr:V-set domain containing T-cell activation inhibitor 1 isoform X1 [Fundulus heteroclitus]
MATIGQIIFYSMVTLIVLLAALIVLILSLAFSKSTSKVMSSNTKPVANLGEDQILSCYIPADITQNSLGEMFVSWEKTDLGLVFRYQNGAPALDDQAVVFKGRVQVFPDAVVAGNASLLLRSVRNSDKGEYTCSIRSSVGQGKVHIQLRTAVFSAPTLKFSNNILTSEASRWSPKPEVTWLNQTGNFQNASTSFTELPSGAYSVLSTLRSAQVSETYSCRIETSLVVALTEATITGTGVLRRTIFTFSVASTLPVSFYLNLVIGFLCMFYVV